MGKKKQKKKREEDRLVRDLAIYVRREGESLEDAEKAVREKLRLSSRQNHITEAQMMWWEQMKSWTMFKGTEK